MAKILNTDEYTELVVFFGTTQIAFNLEDTSQGFLIHELSTGSKVWYTKDGDSYTVRNILGVIKHA